MNEPQRTLINTARQLLDGMSTESRDRGAIASSVELMAPIVSRITGHSFDPNELASICRTLESVYIVGQGQAIALVDQNVRAPEWYLGERRKPGPFMARYLQKLKEDGWPQRSWEEIRDSTARTVELLDDPNRDGPWSWKGLVVGDVQSGKTAHYTGVINRSVDAGYRLIIVLAGMHNVLRLQTQQRLEQDFLGFDTTPGNETPSGPPPIGVGNIPPRLTVGSMTFAASNGDFNLAFRRQANFAPSSQPCLLVVKKNASVLKNLNNWIRGLPEEFRAAPLLLIDDEADQASVDTKDQPTLSDGTFVEDYDPTKINGEIRTLIGLFSRSVYLAYTATPFANILIHDRRTATAYGPDLFPSSFIISLSSPDDYFGPVAVFGTNDGIEHRGVPVVRHVPRIDESWIPANHDKTLWPKWEGRDEVPPSMKIAINDFLLSCAARAARGQRNKHNSMLIHVSRYVDVHDHIHRQVQVYLDEVRARISGGDAATISELEARWIADYIPTRKSMQGTVFDRNITDVTWAQVLECLAESSDKIQVVVANGREKQGIPYERYRESGLSVIAVGGDKLSRGLTLEGLTISYFLRVTKQYDSLLQMGRWFGYRRGFADLCRLHTTPDMEDWFRHVATANVELNAQLIHMRLMLKTPQDYGLKVEAHSIMSVTAQNKQRHGLEVPVAYAGEGKIQTVMFRDRVTLEHNATLTDAFLNALTEVGAGATRPGSNGVARGRLWKASGREVSAYLRALNFPAENVEIIGARLSNYINDQLKQQAPELAHWQVFLPEGEGGLVELAGRTFKSILRTPLAERATSDRFIVRSILNPPDEALDLSASEYEDALLATNQARALDAKPPAAHPSGPEIRARRSPSNGLLIIYPIDPISAKVETGTECPVIGVVVSFPGSRTASERIYIENTVLQRQETT